MATPSKLKICVLGIGLLMVLYIAYPAKENKLLSEYNFEYQEFLKFSENFNKKYSTEDHNQRFQIYNDNIKAIRVFNTYKRLYPGSKQIRRYDPIRIFRKVLKRNKSKAC